jgi:hypothetical protein
MSIVLLGSTSGSCTLQEQAIAGTTTLTLPTTSGTVLTTASTDTANSLNAGLGVNQTWQDLTGSRAIGSNYTNNTGKPILVNITLNTGNASATSFAVNGIRVGAVSVNVSGGLVGQSFIVPNGSTYGTANTAGSNTLNTWAELR